MPVFKVWDAARHTKKAMSVTCSVDELARKGASKLGYEDATGEECKLVLEEDGTCIDDDEVLLEYAGKVLLLLRPGEEWHPASIFPQFPYFETDPGLVSVDDCNPQSSEVEVSEDLLPPPVPITSSSINTVVSPGIHALLKASPLPKFSTHVQGHLLDKNPGGLVKIWSAMIDEAASFYFYNFPDFADQHSYRLIGTRMYASYPSIAMEGTFPWRAFIKSLSQRLRHMRHRQKLKSQPTAQKLQPKKKARLPFSVIEANGPQVSDEDVTRHIQELAKEWGKGSGKRSGEHLKQLLTATRGDRDGFLAMQNNGAYSTLFARYPCFAEDEYIYHSFREAVGSEVASQCGFNLRKFLLVVLEMKRKKEINPDIFVKEPSCLAEAVHFLEKELKVKRLSIVEELHDVADADLAKRLRTKDLESPRLRLILQGQALKGIFVVGDGVNTFVNIQDGVDRGLLILVATYYVFNNAYPKPFSSVLRLLQKFMFAEQVLTGQLPNALTFLARKVQELWD